MRNETRAGGLPTGQVLVGDATTRLKELPAHSVDMVLTSPPYFMLRNYGVDGQLGLESSVEEWVDNLSLVMRQVARVLKPSGSLWLNLGDTYSRRDHHGAVAKSLLLGPERLLVHLVEDGWCLRNKVVWAKPNAAPSPVHDRFNCTWEGLYLLTRSRHYYFDLDAVRVPHASSFRVGRTASPGKRRRGSSGPHPSPMHPVDFASQGLQAGGSSPKRAELAATTRPAWSGPLAGNNWGLKALQAEGRTGHVLGANPGDVWTIPKASFRQAHFATFPKALVERPLLAGCPERVCRSCGAPWWPVSWRPRAAIQACRLIRGLGRTALGGALRKSCGCFGRAWQPGVVCDPFMGAGTTALVAEQLRRHWLGVELNPEFVALSERRLLSARARRWLRVRRNGRPPGPAASGTRE